ncbi:hypothetical protein GUITHDRAFT_134616 [Guillardia theta CCMP2712]|uniref:Uncharacterized protein n=1 Tax=Guillardia theta (strain CCMP2712) TaxID=905079 RepID=L1JRA2_GUITC|nr:hypothetical protein GUITHDRAFT_134616 [Guillardia theta CCMP2712]EKX51096.1 hypothetical protein GUITHDRAFT_134616 [Guillardia theta CCMP2712]|mmetsp:Transcript_27172/g.88813  ORF Transcript_27172/g.88813 Transcript_27172/m.88813 type:complete len:467 (-) Transcript_27172:58-1458(-)|eukprot:XP_005838076.1 hypothetical protein GUITHDRAFT_134616 [Guillardia theta CCMP2712]
MSIASFRQMHPASFKAGIALLIAFSCVALLLSWSRINGGPVEDLGTWEQPHGIGIDEEPWSAPANLWLYWGSSTNRRFTGSGETVRHIFKLGTIMGGEYRDPRFIYKLDGPLFRKLSHSCCVSLLFPPMEWDFYVHNPSKAIGQRLRSFVANGNAMIFTGGIIDFEFINRYFFFNLEQADGDYSPGPFPLMPSFDSLSDSQKEMLERAPSLLPQKGIAVTAVKKESLPQGATVIYGSPKNAVVFMVKFCMADNPANDASTTLPPVRVYPKDCEASAKQGRPCSCGNICYLGYNYQEQYPSRWDKTIRLMVDVCSQSPPEYSNPKNYWPSGASPMEVSQKEEDSAEKHAQDAEEGESAEDDDDKAAQKWADDVERRRVGGGMGGSNSGVLVDNPNSMNTVRGGIASEADPGPRAIKSKSTLLHQKFAGRGKSAQRLSHGACGPVCKLKKMVKSLKTKIDASMESAGA